MDKYDELVKIINEEPVDSFCKIVEYMIEKFGTSLKQYSKLKSIINLCDYCTKEFPSCDAKGKDISFGDGIGDDNVVGCTCFDQDKDPWKIVRDQMKEIEELKAKVEMMSRLPAEVHMGKPKCRANPKGKCSKSYMDKCYSGEGCLFKGLTEE